MSTIGSLFIDIDVSSRFLTECGRTIEFDLSNTCCAAGAPVDNVKYNFQLVRASHCNAVLMLLPLVKFEQLEKSRAKMTVVDPVPTWEPSLVDCARFSIRIEYWPCNEKPRFCV